MYLSLQALAVVAPSSDDILLHYLILAGILNLEAAYLRGFIVGGLIDGGCCCFDRDGIYWTCKRSGMKLG